MIQIIEHVKDQADHIATKEVDIALVENGFFFVLSSIAGMSRQQFETMNHKMQYSNFFGVSMAGSGAGKDTALKAAQNMFEKQIEAYTDIVKKNFDELGGNLPDGTVINGEVDYLVPQSYSFPLRGSVEGMMRAGNYYNKTNIGSLNVISTEFGSEYNPEVLPVLTTLWQDAKADGSTNVNQKYPPIFDVPTNTLLFGSASAFHKNDKKHAYLEEAIESGFARRCNFVWVEAGKIISVSNEDNRTTLQEYAEQIVVLLRKQEAIRFSSEAKKALLEYREKLVEDNNDAPSDWAAIRVSSIDKIERMCSLIALADLSMTIEQSHIEYAIDISERSFEAMGFILTPHAQYKQMYKVLESHSQGLSQTEFIDFGVKIKTKADWTFQVENLKDLARRMNKRIKEAGPRLVLRDLEVSDLSKMIISTSVNHSRKPEMEINFKSQEVQFFGSGMTVESLINSQTQSYCLNHFEATDRAPDGHRKKDHVIPGQNMIAWDIDEGMSIEEMQTILTQYKYILYTTKSHKKDKNGIICDRFRVIIPTKTNFYVNPEEHKGLYENLSKVLEIPSYDVATRNQGRLWFTNKEAKVIAKNDGELLDVRCCIPETEVSQHIIPNIENLEFDEADRRIAGMQKYVLINGVGGNRNNVIFALVKFIIDMGGDVERITHETNQMLLEPLSDTEVNTIIRSA